MAYAYAKIIIHKCRESMLLTPHWHLYEVETVRKLKQWTKVGGIASIAFVTLGVAGAPAAPPLPTPLLSDTRLLVNGPFQTTG